MNTRDLFRAMRTFQYDRTVMVNHSLAFPNVSSPGFDEGAETLLEQAFDVKANKYVLESEEELKVLCDQFKVQTKDLNFKVNIINVR